MIGTSDHRIVTLEERLVGERTYEFTPLHAVPSLQVKSFISVEGVFFVLHERRTGQATLTAVHNSTADVLGSWSMPTDMEWYGVCRLQQKLLAIGRNEVEEKTELWEFMLPRVGILKDDYELA